MRAAGSQRLRYDLRCISLVLGWLDRHGHDTALETSPAGGAPAPEIPTSL